MTKRYGGRAVVDDLSFDVAPGETVALLGPNGAGKTTAVEILEGYRVPDAGVVRVLGLDPIRAGTALKARIGLMLQDGGVYPSIRPREVLRLFASFYARPEDPDALLRLVGLEDAARTRFRRLSGGQKQRLSLALALVGRPELVFLDEPTAAMDPRARHATWDVIRGLKARGVTVLLTTHFMEEAERLADRVAILHRGRLRALDSPAALARAAGARGIRFSAGPGLALDGLAGRLGARRAVEERPGEYAVDVVATPAGLAALAAWLAERDVLVSDVRIGRQSLEEVFLRLTAGDGSQEMGDGAGGREPGGDSARTATAPRPQPPTPNSQLPFWPMVGAQARVELLLALRRGESLLVTLVVPTLLLLFFGTVGVLPTGGGRPVDFLLPGILALAIMSTALVSLGIATAYERHYGVLKRLGGSPLPRAGLLLAKTWAVLAIEAGQVGLLVAVAALVFGWRPAGNPALALLALLLGTAAFGGLGLALAGALRAEATLAVANGLYLLFLLLGGIVFPLSALPPIVAGPAGLLPAAALADTVRAALAPGAPIPLGSLALLACWALATPLVAARVFRWD